MSLDKILADLKMEYLSSLPTRLDGIRKHLHDGAFDVLEDEFHKLKGTGRTYGIPEITDVGEITEIICGDARQHVTTAVPLALDLLSDIHEARLRQETFDVKADPRFSKLRNLV
jgi:hypothetical protein